MSEAFQCDFIIYYQSSVLFHTGFGLENRNLALKKLPENLHLVGGKSSYRKHVIGKPRKKSKPYDLFNKTEDESIVDNGLNKTK